jgi:hypothetical protein
VLLLVLLLLLLLVLLLLPISDIDAGRDGAIVTNILLGPCWRLFGFQCFTLTFHLFNRSAAAAAAADLMTMKMRGSLITPSLQQE